MITANEFVTRRNTEFNDQILYTQKDLTNITSSRIFNGFSDYKKYGYINFPYFKESIKILNDMFGANDVQTSIAYLLEAITSVANPNGWQFDKDSNSLKPIENFTPDESTVLPTPDDFEKQIFLEKARDIYNAYITGVSFIEIVIEQGYDDFQRNGSIFIHDFSDTFYSQLNELPLDLREELWNALNQNLNRSGWQITSRNNTHFDSPIYDLYEITPIA